MSEWQPIETAPRNHAILILVPEWDYYGNEGVYAGMLKDMGTGLCWYTFGWAVGRDLPADMSPTAWMPIPAAPAENGTGTPPNRAVPTSGSAGGTA